MGSFTLEVYYNWMLQWHIHYASMIPRVGEMIIISPGAFKVSNVIYDYTMNPPRCKLEVVRL